MFWAICLIFISAIILTLKYAGTSQVESGQDRTALGKGLATLWLLGTLDSEDEGE